VEYIHREGVIHRDISPDNVMLTEDGHIKFIDFGTLREFRHIAIQGTAGMGKYGYTPPEQWQGKPVAQSDIFALGATIYYLLSGSLPLSSEYKSGQGPQKTDFRPDFAPIRTKNPAVSPQLEVVLQKALQLEVNIRYSSASEMGWALRNSEKLDASRPRPDIKIPGFPVISTDVNRIDFKDVRPGTIQTSSFRITNNETRDHVVEIRTNQPWIKVSPTRLNLGIVSQTVRVTAEPTHLIGGMSDTGNIDVVTDDGTERIKVYVETAKSKSEVHKKSSGKSNWIWIGITLVGLLVATLVIVSNIKSGSHQNSSESKAVPSSIWEEPDESAQESIRSPMSAQPGDLYWKYTSDSESGLRLLVISGDMICASTGYHQSASDSTHVLDSATGKQIWSLPYGGSALAASNDAIYVPTANGVRALNTVNGNKKWDYVCNDEPWTIASCGERIFTGSFWGDVIAVDTSGTQIWKAKISSGALSMTASDSIVYAGINEVSALNAISGIKKWETSSVSGLINAMIVTDNLLYIGTQTDIRGNGSASVYAIDCSNGAIVWRFQADETDKHRYIDSISIVKTTVYAASRQYVYAIDTTSGKEKWRFPRVGTLGDALAVSANMIYIGSDDGVHFVDAITGNEKSIFKTGEQVCSLLLADNKIYAGTESGNLYAIWVK